uniref:Non-SMC condensin II complex subunit D3 n=1 Tax=Anolis carolinensis TaxID=28377 RepID=A0A803TER8_ANOCA
MLSGKSSLIFLFLPSAWVDTTWELEFTDTDPLDPRLENQITDDGLEAFSHLCATLSPFAADDGESIWSLFAENNISHNALVAVFHHFVQEAKNKKANLHQRLCALHAARLYILLIEIPGSIANQVFHPVMFEKCLQTLSKCWPQESIMPRKRKRDHNKNSSGNRKKGKSGRKENLTMEENFEEDEEGEEEVYFSAHELLQIREALFLLLKSLLRLLSKFSLKERPQIFEHVDIFSSQIKRKPQSVKFYFMWNRNIDQAKYIPQLAYFGLHLLCSPLHSLEDKILRHVFHRFLNIILMSTGKEPSGGASAVLPSQAINARNQVPDKSEHRTHAAQALTQLLYRLPCANHADFIAWLYRFSLNNKISYRVFAIDAALALLDLPEREPDVTLSEEQQKFMKHKFLVQVMIFGRCSDKAPAVRSKALSGFAQCLEANNSLPSTPPSHQTGKEIMGMLRLRAGDEKINVRKSALQVLMSILKYQVTPCTTEDLATLQDRCRDPAVSVRKQALQSITDLLLSQPENALIQKAWLKGVIPVIMDCETSVQERALECLDQVLLQPIKPRNRFTPQNESQGLAWDLLTLLTKESQELSRYFNKAFHIWSKQGKVSSSFVNSVISHTETDHAVPAWMLLAKVAGSSPKLDFSKIIEAWDSLDRQVPDVIAQLSSSVDSEDIPSSLPMSQFRGSVMPSVVRAHAFVTLGKLCLQHEDLAKRCIAALARELEVSQDVAIRNNVVIVMCDLCIRYTTMVDRYIPDISVCLKDPEPFIRKQTLILLTNLLQVKSLFSRFVSVLVDPNEDIPSLATFCLAHLLLKRNPAMFSQHFIECIFHFNSYEKHEKYNRFPQSEREKDRFSLKGKANKEKRMQIYKFLLEHFTDEQRFNITSKISLNVLACFVDGVLPLDMEANELLSDTFEILSCKEIKLSAMRSRPEDDLQPDEDELAMANAVMQVAQKKLISQVQKKHFIENTIPIITSLKTLLEQNRLPVLRELMSYLREVMKDYKNEVKEFFAMDKQLAAELEYDMKKYEEQLQTESEEGQEMPRAMEALNARAAGQVRTSSEITTHFVPIHFANGPILSTIKGR